MRIPTSFCGVRLSGGYPGRRGLLLKRVLGDGIYRVPRGFFDRDLGIDLPPSTRKPGSCEARV